VIRGLREVGSELLIVLQTCSRHIKVTNQVENSGLDSTLEFFSTLERHPNRYYPLGNVLQGEPYFQYEMGQRQKIEDHFKPENADFSDMNALGEINGYFLDDRGSIFFPAADPKLNVFHVIYDPLDLNDEIFRMHGPFVNAEEHAQSLKASLERAGLGQVASINQFSQN
jgi:hypothetical protein